VKPVGELYAGNRHVWFDERGWETGRCRMAQVTAPILDSTILCFSNFSVPSAPARRVRTPEIDRGPSATGSNRSSPTCAPRPGVRAARRTAAHSRSPNNVTGQSSPKFAKPAGFSGLGTKFQAGDLQRRDLIATWSFAYIPPYGESCIRYPCLRSNPAGYPPRNFSGAHFRIGVGGCS